MAGAEGFEPPRPVLETGSLAVKLTPLSWGVFGLERQAQMLSKPSPLGSLAWRSSALNLPTQIVTTEIAASFHFLMRSVMLAGGTELLELQPVLVLLPVFSCRIIPIFTFGTLQSDNFAHIVWARE
jgi:hypothetical protein